MCFPSVFDRLYDVYNNTTSLRDQIYESFTFVLEYIERDLEVFLQQCPSEGLEEHVIKVRIIRVLLVILCRRQNLENECCL